MVAGRPTSTLIYYLLTDRQSRHLAPRYRLRAEGVWHWYAGARRVTLAMSRDGK